jgi:hypothetical protein
MNRRPAKHPPSKIGKQKGRGYILVNKHTPEMEFNRKQMSRFLKTVFLKYDMMSFSDKVKWIESK